MASIWERMGEQVGYGLAAVVLGPKAALERRQRRALRAALVLWSRGAELETTKLATTRGHVRRSVRATSAGGQPVTLEVLLDLEKRTVVMSVALERLPAYVEARITRSVPWRGSEPGAPRAAAGDLRLDSSSLDAEAANALVEVVASGPLADTDNLELGLTPEAIELRIAAPESVAEWDRVAQGAVGITTWLSQRWPSSYRG